MGSAGRLFLVMLAGDVRTDWTLIASHCGYTASAHLLTPEVSAP
jgi:hypothetical protein